MTLPIDEYQKKKKIHFLKTVHILGFEGNNQHSDIFFFLKLLQNIFV